MKTEKSKKTKESNVLRELLEDVRVWNNEWEIWRLNINENNCIQPKNVDDFMNELNKKYKVVPV